MQQFPLINEKERTIREFRLWFGLFLGVFVGPVSLGLAWYLKRTRLEWYWYGLLMFGSLLWVIFVGIGVYAADVQVDTVLTTNTLPLLLLTWIVAIPGAPVVSLVMYIGDVIFEFIRHRSMPEQLDDHQRFEDNQNRALSRKAAKVVKRLPAQKNGHLTLGWYMKGDELPSESGITHAKNNWVYMPEITGDQHVLVLAKTGGGKTSNLYWLASQYLTMTNRDVFVIDGKGDKDAVDPLTNLIYQFRRQPVPVFKLGYDEDTSSVYHGFCGDKRAICNRLCALAGVTQATGNAVHFADKRWDILQLICYAPGIEPPRSFTEVRERIDPDWLRAAYRNNQMERDTIEKIPADSFENLDVRLRTLAREYAGLVGPEGFALEDSRAAIFSLKTTSAGHSVKRFVEYLMEDLKDFLSKRQKRPAVLFIDEFGALGLKNIIDALSQGRSAQLAIYLLTQTIASLGEPLERDQILENTNTTYLMATDAPQKLVEFAGTMYQFEPTVQHDEGEPTGMGSSRVQHTFKVSPNDVRKLQPGEAFVIRQGRGAMIRIPRLEKIPHNLRAIAVPQRDTNHQNSTPLPIPSQTVREAPELPILQA